jgi:hypothetical protein
MVSLQVRRLLQSYIVDSRRGAGRAAVATGDRLRKQKKEKGSECLKGPGERVEHGRRPLL